MKSSCKNSRSIECAYHDNNERYHDDNDSYSNDDFQVRNRGGMAGHYVGRHRWQALRPKILQQVDHDHDGSDDADADDIVNAKRGSLACLK